MNIHRWFAPGLLASAICCCAAATPAPPPPTLAQAMEAAWARATAAPETRGRQRQSEAARAAAAAWTPAAPALSLAHRTDRLQHDRGERETEVGLSLPLWRLGQRTARQAEAEAQAAAADAAVAAARLAVAGEVREAAWALADEQAALALAVQEQQVLQRLAEDTDRRVGAGELARADALAARAEWLAADSTTARARQALAVAQSRWTMLTGLPSTLDPSETGAGPGAAQTPIEHHPELLKAAAEVQRTRQRHDSLRHARRSPPELTLSATRETPGHGEPRQYRLGMALQLPLGVDAGTREEEATALTDREVAEAEWQLVRERLLAEQSDAHSGVSVAEQQLAAEQARAALLRERAQLLETSFKVGETPLPDLLRALADANQADAAVARQRAAFGLARARLHQTLGLMP